MPHDYNVLLLLAGLAVLGLTVLPRLLTHQPLTVPVVLILLGLVGFGLPLGLEAPDPLGDHAVLAERLTEFGVIIALTACGLKLDRPFEFRLRAWRSTWLLLGITMPLSIMASAVLGWMAGLPIATAVLLGAVIAPTDPVLASDVQVGPPQQELIGHSEEDEVRFSLTAEAGLNDGLAFPFTNAAILMAMAGAGQVGWIGQWLLVDVVYKVVVGVAAGLVTGWLLAKLLFAVVAATRFAEQMEGLGALAITLVTYGVTELVGGYGFIAVFVAALVVRASERDHEYHHHLHDFAEDAERLLMASVLVGLGGALSGGSLAELDWALTLVGLAIVFFVRPVAGMIGLLGQRSLPQAERWAMSFFGIRGIGSLYYLTHAFNEAPFLQSERLWALVAFVILVSVVVHGLSAKPVMYRLDRLRAAQTA